MGILSCFSEGASRTIGIDVLLSKKSSFVRGRHVTEVATKYNGTEESFDDFTFNLFDSRSEFDGQFNGATHFNLMVIHINNPR